MYGVGGTRGLISSAVHATYPVTDRILLPEAIIGTDIPLTLAPAPVAVVVDIGPDSDSPDADHGKNVSPDFSSPSSSYRMMMTWGILNQLFLAIAG
ncbi:hypothetical protein HAX54_031909 [Datura stramonium]|uniref:Uncharacterized protein n=1 Tax=Datura stramonium TaxID=4076 RepID=A0ABS8VDH3_DATST|nr:hypothetical protein [Datura stramonium]